eukprot:TRINITY_DN752_c0_g2_i1.p2 TRINITY_DN752_c0_g2~~TRINITY_DN752_c0_g2_i1.p2  ORF type:complete len:238 (-),score=69.36 TRINITY_DN752_c0_g2_i1:103-816(-)
MPRVNFFGLRKYKQFKSKTFPEPESIKNINRTYTDIDNSFAISANETFDASVKHVNHPNAPFFIKLQRTSSESEDESIVPLEFGEEEAHIAEDLNKRKPQERSVSKMTDLESNNGIYLTLMTKELFKRNKTVSMKGKSNKGSKVAGIELGMLLKRRKLLSDVEKKRKSTKISINYPRETIMKKTMRSPDAKIPKTTKEPSLSASIFRRRERPLARNQIGSVNIKELPLLIKHASANS